ncbi:MAG: von Willebrand factor type A domain-containing protein, partial [Phycisphaeraceae bacterium]|nr:von Willebrand factor type A domain-containing protein [Phycisphaeraceae bacterium]
SRALGLSRGEDIDLVGGTRVAYDAPVIIDGKPEDLLNASSGTLALGKDSGAYRTADADKVVVAVDESRSANTSQADPYTIKALTESLASLDPNPTEPSQELYWQRTSRAGDALVPADKLASETWRYDNQKPGATTGEAFNAAPTREALIIPEPTSAPSDENRYVPTELDGLAGGQGGGGEGTEGLFADVPEAVAKPGKPGNTGVFGAITLGEERPDSLRWKDSDFSKQLGNDFGTQYGSDRLDMDGDPGAPAIFGIPLHDGRDTDELGYLDGQQGQKVESQNRGLSDDKQWYEYLSRGKQGLGDDAADPDRKVLLRRIDGVDAPDEAVLPKPSEPTVPGNDATFSIEVPTDRAGLEGQIAELTEKLRQAQITVERNSATMQLSAAEGGGKDERLKAQAEQIQKQIGIISELQAQRSDLSLSLIEERSRQRRLSDNYLRIQEENKALASQPEHLSRFADAPGFDLNDALSNLSSGGVAGKAADSDLMTQARKNTAAEKAEQAERALRADQFNAATQLYEDATLLAPDNSAYRGKLAEANDKLKEQMRPTDLREITTVDRTVDRKAAIAEYEKAMTEATKLLEQQDYQAANNAIIEARTTLSRERQVFDSTDYNDRVSRAHRLQDLTQATQARTEADQLKSIELDRSAIERHIASETERRKTEEIQGYLRKARALQLEKKYDESVAELDAALFLDPDNPVIKGLRDMVRDTATAIDSFELKRQREIEIAGGTLQNIEATTPYDDILTYPGDWPELTALRLREDDREQAAEADKPAVTPESEPAPEAEDARRTQVAPPVNPWVLTEQDAQSTFAIDTDTASYELARRAIREQAQLPRISSVRMEEFVNRFDYQYPSGRDVHDTFTVHAEAGAAPFAGSGGDGAVLLKVGVRGRVVARDQMKPAHYVFVIDASGSMARQDRLPLVQRSLAMLLGQLGEQDTVSLVSYETRPYLLLEHASASNPQAIMDAAATIQTGGSTNLTDGLKLGYQVASRHFAPGSVNRVILCSDGVANVGDDDAKQMLEAVKQYRQHGVTLMTVGVGVDGQTSGGPASGAERFNDGLMEQLANQGDGQYVYLGSVQDARRQFVTDLAATRPTIAYDAKIQVHFDPTRVRRYRLIGYENRAIADHDFRNDAVDAGEVGSGQSATALYEVELWPTRRRRVGDAGNLGTVYVRYRDARSGAIEETQTALSTGLIQERSVADNPRFYLAACAAEFAELLRASGHAADGSYARLHRIAREVAEALPLDKDAAELAELIGRADGLPRAGQ